MWAHIDIQIFPNLMIVIRSNCRDCNGSGGMPGGVGYILEQAPEREFSVFPDAGFTSMVKFLLAHGYFWVWVVFPSQEIFTKR